MVKPFISFASFPPCVCVTVGLVKLLVGLLFTRCVLPRELLVLRTHHRVLCLQLENSAKAPEQNSTEQEEEGKDHKDGAIEMDFDFEGQVEDVNQDDEGNPEEEEDSEPEKELTEKMGDLGNELGEELDKNIWDPQEEDKVFIL